MIRQRSAGASILAFLAALTMAAGPVAGFTWTPKVILAGPDPQVGASDGAIAADGANLIVVFVDDGDAWVRTSADGGTTFAAPVRISDPLATDVGWASVAAANGVGYAFWVETEVGSGPRAWLRQTTDGGATWAPAVAVTTAGAVPTAARVFAASGRVFLTWEDATTHRVVLRRSGNAGASFTPPTTIGTSTSGRPATMAFGDQVMYIAWESSTGNVRLRRSTTGGITWNAAATLQTDHAGHTRLARPWLAARGRRAVLATQSTVTLGTIALRVTTDRGASWGATRRPTSTALYDRHPIVVAASAGWWLATRSCDPRECENNSLQVRTSSDGITWSGPTHGGGGGLLYPLGGVYAPATGRVWWGWIQEPTYEQSEQWEILVRASR